MSFLCQRYASICPFLGHFLGPFKGTNASRRAAFCGRRISIGTNGVYPFGGCGQQVRRMACFSSSLSLLLWEDLGQKLPLLRSAPLSPHSHGFHPPQNFPHRSHRRPISFFKPSLPCEFSFIFDWQLIR